MLKLEDRICRTTPNRRVLGRILRMKKDIIRFRRFVYPEREVAEITHADSARRDEGLLPRLLTTPLKPWTWPKATANR
jgi:hypothetical protein